MARAAISMFAADVTSAGGHLAWPRGQMCAKPTKTPLFAGKAMRGDLHARHAQAGRPRSPTGQPWWWVLLFLSVILPEPLVQLL
jgi:hypothetical protein